MGSLRQTWGLSASVSSLGFLSAGKKLKTYFSKVVPEYTTQSKIKQISFDAHWYQEAFVLDREHRYVCICGGMGSGKTNASIRRGILLALQNPGKSGYYFEPTQPLVTDIALPQWEEMLDSYGLEYKRFGNPYYNIRIYTQEGSHLVMLRSLENYERIIGVNAAWANCDEIDTLKTSVAEQAVRKLQGRMRSGEFCPISFSTTPEGFRFIYDFFDRDTENKSKILYEVNTEDNPSISKSFVEDLKANYPPKLIDAYIRGKRVSLSVGRVFYCYEKEVCSTSLASASANEIVYIGMDFNIDNVSAGFFVVRKRKSDGKKVLLFFSETKQKDTYALAQYIRTAFPTHVQEKKIKGFPDASSRARKPSSLTTDFDILKKAGIPLSAPAKNPDVAKTLTHCNNLFRLGLILINPKTCSKITESAEKWEKNKKGTEDRPSEADESFQVGAPKKGGAHDRSHFGDVIRYGACGIYRLSGGISMGQRVH
jgi:hypothetical protein